MIERSLVNIGSVSTDNPTATADNIIEEPSIAINNYPNPVRDHFIVKITGISSSTSELSIVAMNGQLVYSKFLREFDGTHIEPVNVENLPRGVYILSINNGQNVSTSRIVVE